MKLNEQHNTLEHTILEEDFEEIQEKTSNDDPYGVVLGYDGGSWDPSMPACW